MGRANRLIGYVASVASASLFYVIWLMAAFERLGTPKSDVTVLFQIGLAIFFLVFAGMGAAFLLMVLPWCLAVIVHDRWLPFGITYFALTGALTSFLIGCATSSLSPKPLFIEDQTFREGFVIAVQRQGICLVVTGLVFGSTFWLVSERLRSAVPKQHSTGGKAKLLGISKRGNPYLRKILIYGARAAVVRMRRERAPFEAWLDALQTRAPLNVVVVATANKLARIAWAVLSSGEDFKAAGGNSMA